MKLNLFLIFETRNLIFLTQLPLNFEDIDLNKTFMYYLKNKL